MFLVESNIVKYTARTVGGSKYVFLFYSAKKTRKKNVYQVSSQQNFSLTNLNHDDEVKNRRTTTSTNTTDDKLKKKYKDSFSLGVKIVSFLPAIFYFKITKKKKIENRKRKLRKKRTQEDLFAIISFKLNTLQR